MSTNNKSKGIPAILVIIAVLFGLYLLYQLVVLAAKLSVFYGYNFFFLVDNLLRIDAFNPAVSWGILGLFAGSIMGVTVAVRKKKLPKWLILCPLLLTILLITVMGMVNKPGQYPSNFDFMGTDTPVPAAEVTREYYTAVTDVNIRSNASKYGKLLFTLRKGQEVEILQKGIYDSRRTEWVKISYNGQEGFVNLRYLVQSRTTTGPLK